MRPEERCGGVGGQVGEGVAVFLGQARAVLLNFRRYKIGFMCDIKSFFHQIRVDPRDVDAFRYLWFADERMEKSVMMRFLSHVFGSGASSIVTSYVLRHHAHVIRDRYPQNVFEMIYSNFYVDDGSG